MFCGQFRTPHITRTLAGLEVGDQIIRLTGMPLGLFVKCEPNSIN